MFTLLVYGFWPAPGVHRTREIFPVQQHYSSQKRQLSICQLGYQSGTLPGYILYVSGTKKYLVVVNPVHSCTPWGEERYA